MERTTRQDHVSSSRPWELDVALTQLEVGVRRPKKQVEAIARPMSSGGTPHQLSEAGIAEAWEALGFRAADYAHLEPAVARMLLRVCVLFSTEEWNQVWQHYLNNPARYGELVAAKNTVANY